MQLVVGDRYGRLLIRQRPGLSTSARVRRKGAVTLLELLGEAQVKPSMNACGASSNA